MAAYEEIARGKHCRVMMARRVSKEFAKAPAKDRARCLKMLKRFAEDGPETFNREQLRMEGRFPSGKRGSVDIAVWVFKSYQVRIYGGFNAGDFLCVEYDLKKQNLADQGKLRNAARKIADGC